MFVLYMCVHCLIPYVWITLEVSSPRNFKMLTSSCYVALFLALAFAFCNASADHVRLQDNQTMNDNDQVRISLYVAMPPQGYMVMINCNHGGMIFVRAGRILLIGLSLVTKLRAVKQWQTRQLLLMHILDWTMPLSGKQTIWW